MKCLICIIVAFIAAALILLVLAVVWLLPNVMRYELEQELSIRNEGQVSVEHVQMSYKGQIDIRGIKLYDKAKQLWLSIEQIMVSLTDWPSLHPGVEAVRIDGLDLLLSMKDGRLLLPAVRWPGSSDSRIEDLKIDGISISGAALTIADANGTTTAYQDMALSVSRKTDGEYDFVLNRVSGKDWEVLVARGGYDVQSTKFDVSLRLKHQITKTEMILAFNALDMPEFSAEGRLAANLTMTGEMDKDSAIQSSGSVDLSDFVLLLHERTLASDLTARARIDGRALDVNDFTAGMCGGSANGAFYAIIGIVDSQSTQYRGKIRVTDVNYPELTSVLTAGTKEGIRGSLSGKYDFSGHSNEPNALDGKGVLLMNDIDVSILPVIPTIFRFIGLSSIEPLKMSDVEAEFQNVGPVVTIDSGHIANLFAAVEIEPGATVDLQTEQIDGYVVAAPLNKITGLIEKLPIIEIFANLKDKLIRLRVKGNWSEPPSKLISKTPIKDIKDSTLGFIQDTAKTGGQFGKGLLDLFGGLLNTNKNKNK